MILTSLELSGKRQYDQLIKQFNKWNNGKEITPINTLAFLEKLKNDPKKLSNSYLHIAKCALTYSIKRLFLHSPDIQNFEHFRRAFEMFQVKVQKMKVREADLITEKEMYLLEKFLPLKKFILCIFLYSTGVRANEMCSIKISDCIVKDTNVEIKINGKGRRKRFVLIPLDLFCKIRNTFGQTNYLFETRIGNPYNSNSLQKVVSRHVKKIIGRRIYPHLFRHTFITQQVKRGESAASIAEYVGNSAVMIYEVYFHDHADPARILSNMEILTKFKKVVA